MKKKERKLAKRLAREQRKDITEPIQEQHLKDLEEGLKLGTRSESLPFNLSKHAKVRIIIVKYVLFASIFPTIIVGVLSISTMAFKLDSNSNSDSTHFYTRI